MIAQIVCKWVLYLMLWVLTGVIFYGVSEMWSDFKDFLKEI